MANTEHSTQQALINSEEEVDTLIQKDTAEAAEHSADSGGPAQELTAIEPKQQTRADRSESAATATVPNTLQSRPVAAESEGADGSPSANRTGEEDEEEEESSSWLSENRDMLTRIAKWAFLILWVAYSLAAFIIDFERARVLFIIEVVILSIFVLNQVYKRFLVGIATRIIDWFGSKKWLVYAVYAVMLLGALAVMITCSAEDPGRLAALGGLVVFVGGSYLMSWHRHKIRWRPVVWGFGLQFTFAVLILRTQPGYHLFQWLGAAFDVLLDFTLAGSGFVYGYLATDVALSVFAFSVIPTVIFFSALVSVLYYCGVLQFLIYYLSLLMQYTLGTSSSESLNAAGNIFVGMTEAPLLIRPFIKDMTRSELHAVMTGGFATIAGGVLAIYISFGVPAEHLLSASVMSAPAALAISKIVYPEHEISPTAQNADEQDADKVLEQIGHGNETNVIEAAANGASVAVGLSLNIAGMLVAFLALVEMLNYFFAYWGSLIGWDITFTLLIGYICYPIAILMGIHPDDAQIAGELIGQKIVVNEFFAYINLNAEIEAGTLSSRSAVILVYALCGFSNFGSIGITLGGLTPLAPKRLKDLSELVMSAMISGNIACFMTACIAALLFDPERYE